MLISRQNLAAFGGAEAAAVQDPTSPTSPHSDYVWRTVIDFSKLSYIGEYIGEYQALLWARNQTRTPVLDQIKLESYVFHWHGA